MRPATFDHLRKRARARKVLVLVGDDGEELTLTYEGLSRPAFERLQREHPATPEDIAEAKERGDDPPAYHVETFAPILVSACLVEPKLTPEQVLELWEAEDTPFTPADLTLLFAAAWEVCSTPSLRANFRPGSSPTNGSERSLPTAPPGGSPTPGSSDGTPPTGTPH